MRHVLALLVLSAAGAGSLRAQPAAQYTVTNRCATSFVVVNRCPAVSPAAPCVCGAACKCAPGTCPACPAAKPAAEPETELWMIGGVLYRVPKGEPAPFAAPSFVAPSFAAPPVISGGCAGGSCGAAPSGRWIRR